VRRVTEELEDIKKNQMNWQGLQDKKDEQPTQLTSVETDKLREEHLLEVKTMRTDFKKKEQKLFNQLEEIKLTLTAYQMQLDIERSHFDVLVKEEQEKREAAEGKVRDQQAKIIILESKIKSCEEELKEKNRKDAETSCSSKHNSFTQEPQKESKKSIFGNRGDSMEPREDEPDYVINDEKEGSSKEEVDEEEKDLESLVESISGDTSSTKKDLFIPRIKSLRPTEMDEYHEFNVSMIKAKNVNPLNESVIVFDDVRERETINASLAELLRYVNGFYNS
jgi:hypothetical protein